MFTVTFENISRKIDALGRISVPSGLRSRFGIQAGDELNFATFNVDGVNYIGMTVDQEQEKSRYVYAASVLRELGCEIPEKLEEKVNAI